MARKHPTRPAPPAEVVAIGKLLMAARKAQGKTQREIAEELGKTQPTIHAYETGDALPDTRDIRNVARVYGVHPMQLLPEVRAA